MDPDQDADQDPAIFALIDHQKANKKLIFYKVFLLIRYFLKEHLNNFSKKNVQKKSQNSRNQGFSYYFCLMIEGSGSILF
jgi:hypothetical protein